MKNPSITLGVLLLVCSGATHADLCVSVQDTETKGETLLDVNFYEEMFPSLGERGNRTWNRIVLQCNRQRDTKGNEVAKVTATGSDNADKKTLKSRDLPVKVIRGHYNFFGTVATQLKYVYVLSKKDGEWTMIIPYRPLINDLVPNRIDFYVGAREIKNGTVSEVSDDGHAWQLYDAAQVVDPLSATPTLKTSARPIAQTLCTKATFFAGKEDKYDGQNDANAHKRDPENKHISLGKIQYRYKDHDYLREGCRVDDGRDLYWRADAASARVQKVKPRDWIFDNFVRAAESYWSIEGVFQLKLLMKGRNDSSFPKATLDLLRDDDHLTVRFATRFLPYQYNQMYKSNLIQFNNFSTMTTDGTYRHEVGHAFGLDDEYGKSKYKDKTDTTIYKDNGCEAPEYKDFDTATYQMCETGADDVRTIYHYLAVSRYITKQSECDADGDCGAGKYCDKGTIAICRNQCVALKADNDTCDIAGGGHQCKGGHCKWSRCYTPDSVPMGGTCYVDDACRQGKCSAVDGTKGTCVCKEDTDCGTGKYCNAGLDATRNACLALKNDNETCDIAGGGHQCKGGHCKWSRCYTPGAVAMGGTCYVDDACKAGKCSAIDGAKGTCVCKDDIDCGARQVV